MQVVLKRIPQPISMDKNIHILFNEQAVCKRGTKMEYGWIDDSKMVFTTSALQFYGLERRQKRTRMDLYVM